ISCLVVAHAASAGAQTTIRVNVDRSTIWTHDFLSPAAIVRAGTILTVVGQARDWYEVVIPGLDGLKGETGLISKSLVSDGTAPPSSPRRVGPPVARTQAVRPPRLGFAA